VWQNSWAYSTRSVILIFSTFSWFLSNSLLGIPFFLSILKFWKWQRHVYIVYTRIVLLSCLDILLFDVNWLI
jgi:hypothetical protein